MARLIMQRVAKHAPLKVGVLVEGEPPELVEIEYEERIEAQELYCSECEQYIRFPINLALDGNHEIICPKCGHVHYRVVKKGVITEDRYNPIPSMTTYQVAAYQTTTSATSYYQDMTTDNNYTRQAWTDSATSSAWG